MSKIALAVFVRTASSRCPNKVLLDLGGKPAFIHIIERVTSVIDPDYVFVACEEDARDDPIELFAKQYGVDCFRGAEDTRRRVRAAGNKLGLKDDDLFLQAAGDTPLGIYRYLPYIIEQLDKHDCTFSWTDIPEGTLVDALRPMCEVYTYGSQAKWEQGVHIVKGVHYALHPFFRVDCRKMIRLKFPPKYLAPWPWGQLDLDWPAQACVIKEIYRQLYKGIPIDEFDVYELMKQQPRLAGTLPLEFPEHRKKGDGVKKDEGSIREAFFEEFKLLGAEVIELTWGGE